MYCPKCGEPNSDQVKFCRACGEDLSLIAQVMTRSLPVSLLSKMDAYLERKNERLRRDSMLGFLFGTMFLFLCLYHLIVQREGLSLNVGITFAGAFLTYLWAAWDFLVYKRSSARNPQELPEEIHWNEIQRRSRSEASLPPPSITDQTTRQFDAQIQRPKKMETNEMSD